MAVGDDDSSEDDDEALLEGVAAGAVTFVTLGVAFGLIALGNPYFWVAFVVGFGGGIPLAVNLAKYYESRPGREGSTRTGDSDTDAALADLRERYARGDLDETEFEARVERLLETESVSGAREYVERADEGSSGVRAADDTTVPNDEERERA
jgi:uncharacterized membrane protein